MTHKLIKTDNYLLVVDGSEIKDCYYWNELDQKIRKNNNINHPYHKKIIAHLPLNGSPILEGVDLLPPIEDDVEQMAEEFVKEVQVASDSVNKSIKLGYEEGYNKAREKYKYTENDVRKAITMARDLEDWHDLVWEYEYDDIIQSLHQYPTEFECEMIQLSYNESFGLDYGSSNLKPKTLTTAQGRQWVGKYK